MVFNKEVKVGLLTTITLIITYVGFNYLKGKDLYPTTQYNTYYTTYKHAKELTTANKVTLNGFVVGSIKEVKILPEQGYVVQVTLAVAKHIHLTNNTVAKLETNNLLKPKTIELIMQEGEVLKNHSNLLSETDQDLTTKFAEITLPVLDDARMLTLLMNKFMQNLVDNTDRMNAIFTNLEKLSEQLHKTITTNQQDFTTISHNMAEVSSVFSDGETGIKPILVKMNQFLQEANTVPILEVMTNLNNILTKLDNGPLYTNLDQTIVDLDKLIVDLQKHPSRYVHLSLFGNNSIFRRKKKNIRQLPSTSSKPQALQATISSTMTNQ